MKRTGLASAVMYATGAAGFVQLPLVSTRPDVTIDTSVHVPRHVTGPDELHDVVLVGNNWDGTATIFDPHHAAQDDRYAIITTVDVVPDLAQRMSEINRDADRARLVGLNRRVAGEGHDQLVDDLFTSNDGRLLLASRPSLGDVVAIDLESRQIVWRQRVCGVRADHAALSPDGRTLLVSATTARWVHAIDVETGEMVGGFASGDQPHESHYSDDGQRIYHASIGRVFLPVRSRLLPGLKGDRWFQVVDARRLGEPTIASEDDTGRDVAAGDRVLKRVDMGEKLRAFIASSTDAAVRKDLERLGAESAVRPMAVTRDERFAYLQVSFLHGFIEYDLHADRVSRVALLADPAGGSLRANQYQLNSAHHGIALDQSETKLCVAGTVSGYAAIVERSTGFPATYIDLGDESGAPPKPYWATRSKDGQACYVSTSETDSVAIVSFEGSKRVATIRVGDHPQRVRTGVLRLGGSHVTRVEPTPAGTVP